MREVDIAWAAGLFEGEGCFFVNSEQFVAQLSMRDEDVVRRFSEIVGVGSFKRIPPGTRKENHSHLFLWKVGRAEDVFAVAKMFYPYLGERRRSKVQEMRSELQDRTTRRRTTRRILLLASESFG